MKDDIHQWLNRKPATKTPVRFAVVPPSDGRDKAVSDNDGVKNGPVAGRVPRWRHRVRTFGREQAAAAVEAHAGRPERGPLAGRWRSSPIFSGLVIVSGAVMAGLLMGWTVWTLLVPFPSG